jgi:hypothetical protein
MNACAISSRGSAWRGKRKGGTGNGAALSFPLDLADPMQDARSMGDEYPSSQHRIHYPGRRDPAQEAEDKRLTEKSKVAAADGAARNERAAFLRHIQGMPGDGLLWREGAPDAMTYKNSAEMSGNTKMTDWIKKFNEKHPERPFRPEVYTPQARQAAPAVAPAAPQSRVMQNAPAVGVQASASNPQVRTGAPVDFPQQIKDPGTGAFGQTTNAIRNSVLNVPKAGASPLDTLRSAPDDTAARQRVLNRDFSGPKPDGRPDVVYGWAGYGGTGRQLVSVPGGERSGMAHLDALGEFQRKQQQDRVDAYAGTLQRGQTASPAGFAAWSKANPVNYDMQSRAAQAYADAATAPRPVAFNAPPTALNQAQGRAAGAPVDAFNAMRMPDGSLGYARPGGSPTLTTGRSASVTMPNGKVERRAFSDTPLTDAVTNASIGLGGASGLAMTAGAMGAGAMNTRGGSMIAQAVKPPGSDTADPNSVASQAKAATSSVANTPMPITSAVKQAATGAATLPTGYEAGKSAFGALKTGAGLIEGGIKNTSDAIGGTVKGVANFARGFVGASPLDSLSGPPITSTETRKPGPLWNPPPDATPPAVSDDEMAKWRASVGAPDPKEGKGNPYDKRKRNGAYASLTP